MEGSSGEIFWSVETFPNLACDSGATPTGNCLSRVHPDDRRVCSNKSTGASRDRAGLISSIGCNARRFRQDMFRVTTHPSRTTSEFPISGRDHRYHAATSC